MTPERSERFRALLEQRLAELTALDASNRDQAQPVELDQTRVGRLSRQDALQSQALSVAALQRNREQINRLRRALRKLDEGEYGWCEECGGAIPEARLDIDPAADHCVACARRLEDS